MSEYKPDYDDDGIPLCSTGSACFDGKRCKIIGFPPSRICEPAVKELVRLQKNGEGRIKEMVDDFLSRESDAARAEADNVQKKLEHEQAQFHRAYTDMTKAREEADKLRGVVEGVRTTINKRIPEVANSYDLNCVLQLIDLLDANPPEVFRGSAGYYEDSGADVWPCIHLEGEPNEEALPHGLKEDEDVLIIKMK